MHKLQIGYSLRFWKKLFKPNRGKLSIIVPGHIQIVLSDLLYKWDTIDGSRSKWHHQNGQIAPQGYVHFTATKQNKNLLGRGRKMNENRFKTRYL